MFTGIIEFKAKVLRNGKNFIEVENPWNDLKIGESVSVNGCCLTVRNFSKKSICFDVSYETLKKTNLKYLKAGDYVNLERSLKVGDRIGGHFVYGHVDTVGRILRKYKKGKFFIFTIKVPSNFRKYVFRTSSVAVEGVSLTVQEVKGNEVVFVLIPETIERTNLGLKKVGELVNIEFDMMVKKKIESNRQ
ncbi:MAG: riboflavin synthase [Caldiserica bacterium]|nr:MAG: riboflavin synthase [Caldisericota bacterium]